MLSVGTKICPKVAFYGSRSALVNGCPLEGAIRRACAVGTWGYKFGVAVKLLHGGCGDASKRATTRIGVGGSSAKEKLPIPSI